jgi:hypothetical protein
VTDTTETTPPSADLQEMKIDTLIQVMAVLLARLGGDAVISHEEFASLEGVSIIGRNLPPSHIMFRLEDEVGEVHGPDCGCEET